MQMIENFDDLFSPQPVGQPTPQGPVSDKEAWAVKKQQEREAVYHQIDEMVSTMSGDGGLFQAYLDVQAKFDRYSVANAVLIADQMPNATRLADFDSWKANGIYVKRGETGISILEPGKEYRREDGSVGVSYNVKKVFDISQTNAPARPPRPQRDDRTLLKALLNEPPCKIEVRDEVPDGRNAAYIPDEATRSILIRRGLDAHTIFRGLAQELCRAYLDKNGWTCASPDFAVYSAAYLLCQRNGIPTDGFSFQRMPEAYRDMDPQELRKELGVIRNLAGDVTYTMSHFFECQQLEQKRLEQKNRDSDAR